MHRRTFLQTSLAGTVSLAASRLARAANEKTPASGKTLRAGVIGATGRGDYGHAIDLAWKTAPSVKIVAAADSDPAGREAAGKRLVVDSLYSDYRQMLEREKLDVVSICPRWLGDREAMLAACAAAGCHIFCEKPFAADVATADRMLAACKTAGVKVAVAHQQRVTPGMTQVRAMLADGRLGKILALRGRGKEDARAGGQDMIVLGIHLFDMMTLLAGEPQWASAEVTHNGRPMTKEHARPGDEQVGLIAGNEIAAMFGFDSAVHGYFESKATAQDGGVGERFQLAIECTKGTVLARGGFDQFYLPQPAFNPSKNQKWESLGPPEWRTMKPADRSDWCNAQIVSDLLRAIEENREPICSAAAASRAVEMCQAVYAAHVAGGRVNLPLTNREHPLSRTS
jgi:predicted dehydrogenase